MNAPAELHLDLDGAWPRDLQGALAEQDYLDCREWGAPLRYSSTRECVEEFFAEVEERLAPWMLYGSGDFHFLTALWLRRIEEPFTLITFDNHPDWDVRPPHWCCGTWVNRALELPALRRAALWGCGNFELNWPHRMWANHKALRAERLHVWPWAERIEASTRQLWPGITRENWREEFTRFAGSLAGEKVYVTVDLDCLDAREAVTNWENGLFSAGDVAWALRALRERGAKMIGGDVCGAWSPIKYARWKQRIEGMLDHPRGGKNLDAGEAMRTNLRALRVIWPALTGRDQHESGGDQQHAQP